MLHSKHIQEYGASRSVAPGEWRIALAELAAEGTGAAAAQVQFATGVQPTE